MILSKNSTKSENKKQTKKVKVFIDRQNVDLPLSFSCSLSLSLCLSSARFYTHSKQSKTGLMFCLEFSIFLLCFRIRLSCLCFAFLMLRTHSAVHMYRIFQCIAETMNKSQVSSIKTRRSFCFDARKNGAENGKRETAKSFLFRFRYRRAITIGCSYRKTWTDKNAQNNFSASNGDDINRNHSTWRRSQSTDIRWKWKMISFSLSSFSFFTEITINVKFVWLLSKISDGTWEMYERTVSVSLFSHFIDRSKALR